MAAAEGRHEAVEAELGGAIEGLRSLELSVLAGRAQTDLAAWLIDRGRAGDAAAVLGEAGGALEALRAAPALARAPRA